MRTERATRISRRIPLPSKLAESVGVLNQAAVLGIVGREQPSQRIAGEGASLLVGAVVALLEDLGEIVEGASRQQGETTTPGWARPARGSGRLTEVIVCFHDGLIQDRPSTKETKR